MKWFKHHSDASLDDKICRLEDEFGYVGYGVYWKIVELCAMQWDGKSNPIFEFNRKKMKSLLSINYMKIESILSFGSVLNLFSAEIFEKSYTIELPKLLEVKDNHTRNLQVACKKVSRDLPLEQNRTEQIIKKKTVKLKFDIEDIYNNYPKKTGKASGIKKLQSIIKTQAMYDNILQGAKRYSIETSDTEKRFIKNFSTWVNQECWQDEPEKTIDEQRDEYDKQLIELMGGE